MLTGTLLTYIAPLTLRCCRYRLSMCRQSCHRQTDRQTIDILRVHRRTEREGWLAAVECFWGERSFCCMATVCQCVCELIACSYFTVGNVCNLCDARVRVVRSNQISYNINNKHYTVHLDRWSQSYPPINRIRIWYVYVWQCRFNWCDYLIIAASTQRELQRHRCSMLARRALACDTAPSAPQVRTRHLLARPRLGNTLKRFKTRVFEHFFSTRPRKWHVSSESDKNIFNQWIRSRALWWCLLFLKHWTLALSIVHH